jgi:hypothetical protein
MARRYFTLIVFGAVVSGVAPALDAQTGVPGRYAGNWVCQTVMPGYNILLPGADPSQPLTNKSTTRRREPHLPRPFRAWGYPWTTIAVPAER